MNVQGAVVTLSNVAALEALAKPDPLIDNHAPRGGDIIAEADAEVWSSEWNCAGGLAAARTASAGKRND